jgi:hypothetical protein
MYTYIDSTSSRHHASPVALDLSFPLAHNSLVEPLLWVKIVPRLLHHKGKRYEVDGRLNFGDLDR